MFEQRLLLLLLCWSSVAVIAAWLTPQRWQTAAISTCGAGFLTMAAPLSAGLLAIATLASFLVVKHAGSSKTAMHSAIIFIACGYLLFMARADKTADGIGAGVILPLGMAYYSLRLIHYLLESYKGKLRAHSFGDYLCYQFFPSALLVGPLHRFDEFLRDLRRRRWEPMLFSRGLERILYGLAKLIVIGNYLIGVKLAVALAVPLEAVGLAGDYLRALVFWLKLYILFSGYSDLAVGFGLLMGFHLRENFNWPFLSHNIAEFWRRWHMSLSSWCRDYVFTAAFALTRNRLAAVLAAMVVLGLWHELSLRYLLWGAYHGLGIACYRWFSQRASRLALPVGTASMRRRVLLGVWRVAAIALTFHFVLFSFHTTSAIERVLLGR